MLGNGGEKNQLTSQDQNAGSVEVRAAIGRRPPCGIIGRRGEAVLPFWRKIFYVRDANYCKVFVIFVVHVRVRDRHVQHERDRSGRQTGRHAFRRNAPCRPALAQSSSKRDVTALPSRHSASPQLSLKEGETWTTEKGKREEGERRSLRLVQPPFPLPSSPSLSRSLFFC